MALEPCEHEPSLDAITPADGAPGIVDIPCAKCGVLGSVRVAVEDIQWDVEPQSHGPLCASRASGECTCGQFEQTERS